MARRDVVRVGVVQMGEAMTSDLLISIACGLVVFACVLVVTTLRRNRPPAERLDYDDEDFRSTR